MSIPGELSSVPFELKYLRLISAIDVLHVCSRKIIHSCPQ